jgi:hypothetical protein
MVLLDEEDNSVYYIHLLEYVVEERFEEVEVDDAQEEQEHIEDNDEYQQVDNGHPLVVDNNF